MSLRARMGVGMIGLVALCGGAGLAFAAQTDPVAELRASLQAGEQADGYLGVVGEASPAFRAEVQAVNTRRLAYYTDLAAKRGAQVEEVAAQTACELFRTKVGAQQYYRLPDGVWRRREGFDPVPLPSFCN